MTLLQSATCKASSVGTVLHAVEKVDPLSRCRAAGAAGAADPLSAEERALLRSVSSRLESLEAPEEHAGFREDESSSDEEEDYVAMAIKRASRCRARVPSLPPPPPTPERMDCRREVGGVRRHSVAREGRIWLTRGYRTLSAFRYTLTFLLPPGTSGNGFRC